MGGRSGKFYFIYFLYLKWMHFIVGKLYLNKIDFQEHSPGAKYLG